MPRFPLNKRKKNGRHLPRERAGGLSDGARDAVHGATIRPAGPSRRLWSLLGKPSELVMAREVPGGDEPAARRRAPARARSADRAHARGQAAVPGADRSPARRYIASARAADRWQSTSKVR